MASASLSGRTSKALRAVRSSLQAHKRPTEQSLFGIVQGGLDRRLRDICLKGDAVISPEAIGLPDWF